MLSLTFKRHESVRDAVLHRLDLATERDKKRAVKDAERILRRAMA
jgi:hypothetical protein